jgi:putative endonuclease
MGRNACRHSHRKNSTQVLLRNWPWNRYEIDLIARTGKVWAFVEVRVRRWGFGASGVEAVNSQKQEPIIQAARHFLRIHDINAPQIRFDISIEYKRRMRRINHIPDAFICLPT